MITWPSQLPLPEMSYSGQSNSSVLVTEMDSGRKRQRRRFGGENNTIQASWTFDETQFQQFKTFFRDTLYAGTAWFDIALPGESEAVDEIQSVRFLGGKYTYRHVAWNHWRVQANLEKEIHSTIADPDPDLMPLLHQRVQVKTSSFTLAFTDLNSFIVIDNGDNDITITLPGNAGFSDKFSCAFTKTGDGEVKFVPSNSNIQSMDDMRAIYEKNSLVTVAYIGSNLFFLGGSLMEEAES